MVSAQIDHLCFCDCVAGPFCVKICLHVGFDYMWGWFICVLLLREARDADLAASLSMKLLVEEQEQKHRQEEQDMLYARNLMVSCK